MIRMASVIVLAACLGAAPLLPAEHLYLDFSTYLGGTGNDRAAALAVGPGGDIFLAGVTDSSDYPAQYPYQSSLQGGQDAFVARLSPSGSAFVYSTYLGGGLTDWGFAVAVDSGGVATVSGKTESDDFPTVNPYQSFRAGYTDVFISRLAPDGSALLFSTYWGGTSHDYPTGIALDADGGVGVTGYTQSSNFPLLNAYQSVHQGGTYDAFLSRFSPSASALVFSTYLGGSGMEWGEKIAFASDNQSWAVGYTESDNFPTREPYQASSAGGFDIFLSRFSSAGSLLFSGYFGGSGYEDGYGLCLNSTGEPFVAGSSGSNDYPIRDAYQSSFAGADPGKWDVVISRFTSSGSDLTYSTYLGGSGIESGFGIALDSEGRISITGSTYSSDFPVRSPYQGGMAGMPDVFLGRFSSSGSTLDYSTYLGGSGEDNGWAIGLGSEGNACVAGRTYSADFPVSNAYQSTHGGGQEDAIVAKLAFRAPTPPPYVIDSGDYDGDGTSDIGVFRGSAGLWSIRNLTRLNFGSSADCPVPADYAGDGTTAVAVFRPASGFWSIRGLTRIYFGGSGDYLVPADYSGDGTAAVAVFRPSSGLWSIHNLTRFYFGSSADQAVPGVYRASGESKIPGVFRQFEGLWSVRELTRFYFGISSDIPVPGNYQEASSWEAAIFRPATGMWSVRDLTRVYFGGSSDVPLPAKYPGGQVDGIGVFRPSTGLWSIRDLTRFYFGSSGDIPLAR